MSDRIAVMSKGRILQVGSPRDIYDRPSERFVADFIGETNFLEGELVSSAKGQAKIKLNEGPVISAGLADGIKPSGRVTIVVRPEHATLVSKGKIAILDGILQNVVYFGTDTHYHVKLSGGGEFIVRQQNSFSGGSNFKAGQAVGIGFENGAAQVLKD
jgi:spermidine/putrescine transport system ATP-binding protein